ncbi:MAG: hypothetical protein ACI8ZB_003133 [Desulforhopalus sp.]|jgi:hypothetical protein
MEYPKCPSCNVPTSWAFEATAILKSQDLQSSLDLQTNAYFTRYFCTECGCLNSGMTEYVVRNVHFHTLSN